METILLDGTNLTPELLVRLSKGNCTLDLTAEAWEKVRRAREVVDDILKNNVVAYGINTGFGFFADKIINESELDQLQVNLIRSHCAGVGAPLSVERTRMLLALRVNVLCKGHSGIR
jgi:histidine ammonia-lyase